MNTSFNAETFVATVAHKHRLFRMSFSVREAARHLLANPELGLANQELTHITWTTQPLVEHQSTDCLVGRAPSGVVAFVIYPEAHYVMAACEKEMPEEVLQALSDMLQCLEAGNAPWVRTSEIVLRSAFDIVFAGAPKVDYQDAWANGTGYLDGAVNTSVDAVKAFIDARGRRGLLLPCDKADLADKSVVIFERYTGSDHDAPLVFNAPSGYMTVHAGLARDVAHLHQRLLQAADIKLVDVA